MARQGLVERMAGGCLMARTRLLGRVVSSFYETELLPLGLKPSQLSLLVFLAKAGPVRRAEVARMMHLDGSTLTRNLKVMLAQGWVEEVAEGQDGRGRPLRLSAAGMALLEQAEPGWQRAQRRAGELLGAEGGALVLRLSAGLMCGGVA